MWKWEHLSSLLFCWLRFTNYLVGFMDCAGGQWGSAGRGPGLLYNLNTSGHSLEPRERWKKSYPLIPSVVCCTCSSVPNNAKLKVGRNDDMSLITALGRRQEKDHSKFKVPGLQCAQSWLMLTIPDYLKKYQLIRENKTYQPNPLNSYLNGNTHVYHVWISRKDCCI